MKLPIDKRANKKGFTLIELLVVIAILATLSGLAYGPIMKHLRGADLLKAKKVCKDLTSAIDSYESEYDSLPYTGTYPSDDEMVDTNDAGFLEVLMGIDTEINDRGKQFFTADAATNGKDGMVYTGNNPSGLTDKWGNPYHILLDYGDDDQLDPAELEADVEGKSYETILRIDNAIAASPGPDALFNDEQDAKSW